jgi:hypothetical protein
LEIRIVLTLWCVTVVLLSPLAAGIPLCWLLNGWRPFTAVDYVLAPFVGLAGLFVVLQNLVYLDVPIKFSAPFVWLALFTFWWWFWRSGRARLTLTRPPLVLLAAVFVYLVQGAALFRVGVSDYVGRGFTDQYNYTGLAQFMLDEPFSLHVNDVLHRPFLASAIILKHDRIGQSVLHAFFAGSSFQEARTLFEPMIILAPALVVLATYLIAFTLGLSPPLSLAGAVTAGLLPALTVVHLESFLSHSLGIAFLLVWPVALAQLAEEPGWRQLLRAILLMTASGSIYTELLPIILGLMVLVLGVAAFRQPYRLRLFLCFLALGLSLPLLNFGLVEAVQGIFPRVGSRVLIDFYPWAFTVEGWARLWLGDLAHEATDYTLEAVRVGTLGFSVLAYLGWCLFMVGRWQGRPVVRGPLNYASLAFALGVAALVVLPLLVAARDDKHPYQFYKLLETTSPLLMLGIVLFFQSLSRSGENPAAEPRPRWKRVLGATPQWLVLIAICFMTLWATFSMIRTTAHLDLVERSNVHILRAPAFRDLAKRLHSMRDQPLVLAAADAVESGFLNAWISYFARHNPVWLLNARVNDIEAPWPPELRQTLTGDHLPFPIHVLATVPDACSAVPGPDATLEWENSKYQMWVMKGAGWALPVGATVPNTIERVGGQPFFWLGNAESALEVLAGGPGTLVCQANLVLGPCITETSRRRLHIRTIGGFQKEVETSGGLETFRVPLPGGRTSIYFSDPEQPTHPAPGGDHRILLLGVQGLHLQFLPLDEESSPRPSSKDAAPHPPVLNLPSKP